jgi:hypothetical protein
MYNDPTDIKKSTQRQKLLVWDILFGSVFYIFTPVNPETIKTAVIVSLPPGGLNGEHD